MPVGHVRFFIPWDAAATADARGNCTNDTNSSYTQTQTSDLLTLFYSILGAQQNHLNVLVAITGGKPNTNPVQGLAVLGDTNQPSDTQYYCAFAYLTSLIRSTWGFGAFVHEYELFNEPDVYGIDYTHAARYFTDALYADGYTHYVDPATATYDGMIIGAFSTFASGGREGGYIDHYLAAVGSQIATNCGSGPTLCIGAQAISGYPDFDPIESAVYGYARMT